MLIFSIQQNGLGQPSERLLTVCNCSVMLDPDYSSPIELYDSPNGQRIQTFRHNLKDEDLIVLAIKGKQAGFFKISVSYALSGYIKDGWIKIGTPIGVFSRDYTGKGLVFYSAADKTSKTVLTMKDYTKIFFKATDCSSYGWLRVRFKHNGSFHEGWIAKEDQCDNPYTTCN